MEITIPAGKGGRRLRPGALAMAAILAAGAAAAEPVATAGRVIADPTRLRVVIDVAGTTPYRATIPDGTNVLNIDLPGTGVVDAAVCEGLLASPTILACSFGRLMVGYGRLRIELPGCGTVDTSRFIAPIGTEPGQIVVDVVFGRPLRCAMAP